MTKIEDLKGKAAPRKGVSTLVYLACPYSHHDETVRLHRFRRSNQAAARLMSQGAHVFAPISHTHPIAMDGDLPLGWEFWERYARAMIAACGRMAVLTIDGWKESKGVQAELTIAEEMGLDVELLHPGFGT